MWGVGVLWSRETLSSSPSKHGMQWRQWQKNEQRMGGGQEHKAKRGTLQQQSCALCAPGAPETKAGPGANSLDASVN